ncbi:alpha/beta fold hydrolase [Dyadobacter fanqingshengii]|uniref:Alpha/beta fold hydrolase n=1 Tax=Dyadobacter fanqingshengii TaxID=2906443 RepID=A0A9X1P6P9_9BACT|nr:alpha/beta fold hydrolase [Dyadobacter fanqingshengii]MCF0039751.1 alpha/beta fold hydrolase [Dyadobacter fanqingshengii]USJ38486.1 alpha/beta fold hydrolase [Dyadobacter fanqingshengii]
MRSQLLIAILSASFYTVFGQQGLVKGHPQLAYWKLGNKSEVVIVLHGGPACHHEYLRPELDLLGGSATIIYYDQRGCGKSERSNSYTWKDHVKDLQRLITDLAPRKKIFLAGSSWGSLLAILYVYTYPKSVKGLILSGTVRWMGEGAPYIRDSEFKYNKPHKQPMHEKALAESLLSDGTIELDTIEISKMLEVESGIQLHEAMASLISAPIADSLAKIRVPILMFNGERSHRYDWVDKYMELFPKVELHTFPVAGHDPWFSNPKHFAKRCNEFIFRNK